MPWERKKDRREPSALRLPTDLLAYEPDKTDVRCRSVHAERSLTVKIEKLNSLSFESDQSFGTNFIDITDVKILSI